MEELQSTEVLDREILEDARKKAWRILKTADDTIQAQTAEWEKEAASRLKDLYDKHVMRIEKAVSEIVSRLPMEKRRIRSQAVDKLLDAAVNTWYSGLTRGYIINLMKNELGMRLAEYNDFSGKPGKLRYSGLSRGETEEIIHSQLPDLTFPPEEIQSDGVFPELEIDNDTVRLCVSLKSAVDYFLLGKRAELITALAGPGFSDENSDTGTAVSGTQSKSNNGGNV